MKYLKIGSYKNNPNGKAKMNRKKKLILILAIILIVVLAVLGAVYVANASFRSVLDQYVFRKNITQNHGASIEISNDSSEHIYAYDRYITILNKNSLKTYSSSGKKEFDTEVSISDPLYCSDNRFLCMGEKEGQKLYLLSGQNILWQKDVDGKIAKVNVNKNGYVSVIVTGTSYKSIVIIYTPEGKELFKTYLSNTIAIGSSLSTDNKYLAIAEVDTSGSALQSNIKLISMDKAASDPSNSVEYMYPASSNEIIAKIKYQDKGKLSCMYDTSFHLIQNNTDAKLIDISDKKDLFSDLDLKDHVVKVSEKSSGLFSEVQVQITDINSKKESIYSLNSLPRDLSCYENTIAINLGTEVHFIDTNGWLIKKYSSSQEVKNIVLGSSIAGIVYRDKIEIVSL